MVASLMAYVAYYDRLVLGSSSADSVGVLVGAIFLPLILKRIYRVGVSIVWVVLVAISKVTSSRVLSATAIAAIAASAAMVAAANAACCAAYIADPLPALPSRVAILAPLTALAVKLFATSRLIVHNYIDRLISVIQACHEGFITADNLYTKLM